MNYLTIYLCNNIGPILYMLIMINCLHGEYGKSEKFMGKICWKGRERGGEGDEEVDWWGKIEAE